jgi:hypothetical protein
LPSKSFQSRFIALLRSFLRLSRRYTGLQLTSSNRGSGARNPNECSRKDAASGKRPFLHLIGGISSEGISFGSRRGISEMVSIADFNDIGPPSLRLPGTVEPGRIPVSSNYARTSVYRRWSNCNDYRSNHPYAGRTSMLEIEFWGDWHTEGSEEQHSMEGNLKPRPRDRTRGV